LKADQKFGHVPRLTIKSANGGVKVGPTLTIGAVQF
jgi:hypothetical protein